MTLFWPATAEEVETSEPRMHVLVIGVGEYPHLDGGSGLRAKMTFGLGQLTSTSITAAKVANFFTGQVMPPVPLGSVELLLPGGTVTRDRDGAAVAVDAPTIDGIEKAFNRWKKRCDGNKQNIAVFYYAGHGLSTSQQFLLPSDFGDPDFDDPWRNCIDFTAMRAGMRSSKAETQVFFIDACREKVVEAELAGINGRGLCKVDFANLKASSSVYFAASDGFQAFGPKDGQGMTYFGDAVLRAFEGAGADDSDGPWSVNTASIGFAIQLILAQMSNILDKPLTCSPVSEGLPRVLHTPVSPFVHAMIDCPQDSRIEFDGAIESNAGEPRPWTKKLLPGRRKLLVANGVKTHFDGEVTMKPPVFNRNLP